jgi:hypothetical protein
VIFVEPAKGMAESAPIAKDGTNGGLVRAASSALVHGFGVSARDLSKLHVAGKHDECIAHLEKLGGVRGIADKLSVKLKEGITGDEEDINHRKEGWVCVGVLWCAGVVS